MRSPFSIGRIQLEMDDVMADENRNPGVGGGVAGGTSGETGSASGTNASPDEAAGTVVADERTEAAARRDRKREEPVAPGLEPRPDLRGA